MSMRMATNTSIRGPTIATPAFEADSSARTRLACEFIVVADLGDVPPIEHQRTVAPRAEPVVLRRVDEKSAQAEQGSGLVARRRGRTEFH